MQKMISKFIHNVACKIPFGKKLWGSSFGKVYVYTEKHFRDRYLSLILLRKNSNEYLKESNNLFKSKAILQIFFIATA